jgi:hypothetical protein
MPRLVDGPVSAAPLPLRMLFRAVAPILMGSPGFGASLLAMPFFGDDGPAEIQPANKWIHKVSDTDVLLQPEPVVGPIARAEPFATNPFNEVLSPELERAMGILEVGIVVYDPYARDTVDSYYARLFSHDCKYKDYRHTVHGRERLDIGSKVFGALAGGGTVLKLLTDTDWQPSTAKPESYRPWEFAPVEPSWFWGSISADSHIQF